MHAEELLAHISRSAIIAFGMDRQVGHDLLAELFQFVGWKCRRAGNLGEERHGSGQMLVQAASRDRGRIERCIAAQVDGIGVELLRKIALALCLAVPLVIILAAIEAAPGLDFDHAGQ